MGEFKKGERHGKGQVEIDGKKYEADWNEGEMDEETKVEKEVAANNKMFGAIAGVMKNVFLEELKKQQASHPSDTSKKLGKKFQFKLQLAQKHNDKELEKKLMQEAKSQLLASLKNNK